VVIDVVRANGRARNPAQQIILFVRRAIRADEANRIRAGGFVYIGEAPGSFGQGVFPARGHELAVAAHKRDLQALGVIREIKSEAALHAQEILVESGEVAIVGAQNFIIAHA
jgi:hypothetical protein